MRLCFLYKDTYAPYSKWFGTAFQRLELGGNMKQLIAGALSAHCLSDREDRLVEAQAAAAALHNASGLTDFVSYRIESYYGRNIKVIYADRFAEAAAKTLAGTAPENVPLLGTLSQAGGLSSLADDPKYYKQISKLYRPS